MPPDAETTEAMILDALARDVNRAADGITAKVARGRNGYPTCRITGPNTYTEWINVREGKFVWSDGDVIGPIDDIPAVAVAVLQEIT
jgi:hypothetical protein